MPERNYTDDELVYAAHTRCPCGAGLAYIPGDTDKQYWDCAKILKGTADRKVQHTAILPFVFYEIKSEKQPSANGATTRNGKNVQWYEEDTASTQFMLNTEKLRSADFELAQIRSERIQLDLREKRCLAAREEALKALVPLDSSQPAV